MRAMRYLAALLSLVGVLAFAGQGMGPGPGVKAYSGGGSIPVAHNGTDAAAVSTTNNTTVATTITVGGGLSNAALVCIIEWSTGTARTISGVSSDVSSALTLITGSSSTSSSWQGVNSGIAAYIKLSPTAGANVVTVTFSGNTSQKYIGCGVYTGVHQTTAYGTPTVSFATAQSSPTTVTVSGTSTSGMVVGALISVASSSTDDVSVNSPATQGWEQEEQVFVGSSMAGGYVQGSATSTGIAFAHEASQDVAYTAFELKAASP